MPIRRRRRKNNVLQQPAALEKVAQVRQKLAGTDRDDHLEIVDGWEKKVKDSLIKLSLTGHEGIQMLVKHATDRIVEINKSLRSDQTDSFSAADMQKYAISNARKFEQKAMWLYFLSFFSDAQATLDSVEEDLDKQLSDEEEEPTGGGE